MRRWSLLFAVAVALGVAGEGVASNSGTITFTGRIVDGNVDRSTLVEVDQVPGAEYPYQVYTKPNHVFVASFPTQAAADQFVQQVSLDKLLQ